MTFGTDGGKKVNYIVCKKVTIKNYKKFIGNTLLFSYYYLSWCFLINIIYVNSFGNNYQYFYVNIVPDTRSMQIFKFPF